MGPGVVARVVRILQLIPGFTGSFSAVCYGAVVAWEQEKSHLMLCSQSDCVIPKLGANVELQ